MATSPAAPVVTPRPQSKTTHQAASGALRIIPLGGLGEFGLNMMCYEFGDERLVVDCGSMTPEADMLGVDLVIPDVTYLLDAPARLKGIVLTHGHDDHIAALPYVLSRIRAPIHGTRLTLALLEAKLEEHEDLGQTELVEIQCRRPIRIGRHFEVCPIHVTHSMPDSVALAIRTPAGTVVHTGDYKIDHAPVDRESFDFFSFAQLGEEGVLALVADSTNADCAGSTPTEGWVGKHLEPIFSTSHRAIICSTFASSLHRLQLLMDLAVRFDRRIFIAGRGLERNFAIGSELGYLSIPYENFCSLREIEALPPHQRFILATGCQGEPLSVMSRVALGEHKQIEVAEGDTVILSSRIIPGNERAIYRMVNHLCRRGARVFDQNSAKVHVSGHGCREEMKALINLVRPRYLLPVHGGLRQLKTHRELAIEMGFDPDSVLVLDNGDILEVHPHSALVVGKAPTGRVLVDGKTVGETGDVVLRDRQHLSEDGMLIAILNVDRRTGELITEPEIVTRGFVYVDESEDLINALRGIVRETFEACAPEAREESETVNAEVRRALRKYIRRNYDRYPLILPVVQEI